MSQQRQEQQQRQDGGGGGGYDPHREQQSRSIRAGTQVVTKSMSRFVSAPGSDGQYNFDLDTTYSRIRIAAKFIKRTITGDGGASGVLVFSSKEIARESIERFCEETGATPKMGRFMPGTLTNPSLPYYTEPTLVVVSDPQADAQAVTEATNAGVPVVGVSSTEGMPFRVDVVIPANNRDRRALEGVYKRLAEEIDRVAVDPSIDGNVAAAAEAAAASGRDAKEAEGGVEEGEAGEGAAGEPAGEEAGSAAGGAAEAEASGGGGADAPAAAEGGMTVGGDGGSGSGSGGESPAADAAPTAAAGGGESA